LEKILTTFTSRELVRDEIASFFVTDGSFQEVYQYFPSVAEIKGKTPVLIIRSRGTEQDFSGLNTNPTSYRFLLTTFILAFSDDDSWSSSDAEDSLDDLDKVIRQVIRDNAGGGTYADNYRFEGGFSDVNDIMVEGLPYIVETRAVVADLPKGSK
jgi:hypothetical protein